MKKLLRYMRGYRKECVLAPLAKLLEAGFELFVPLVVASIIDKGIGQNDPGYIGWMCLLLVGLGVVGLAVAVVAQYFAARAATGFAAKLRHVLFAHLQSLSYRELDSLGTSTMLTRMTSDMEQVQNGVNLTLRLVLRSPFVVLGAWLMAYTIDAKAAGVFAVVIPLLFAVVIGIMCLTIPRYRKVQGKLDRVTQTVRENLTGVRVVRAFGAEQKETERFHARTKTLYREQTSVGSWSALTNPLTFVIINLGIVWLVRVGAIRVDSGALTQGQVIALYNYLSQILVELLKTANCFLQLTRAVACGNRIQSVLDLHSSIAAPTQMPQEQAAPILEFDHVSFRYHGGEPALENLNLTVRKGQTIGVIGGTGAGKTTLVNLIGRFYDPTEGVIRHNGVDLRDYPLQDLRSRIGIVPQKAVLFRGTIRENLRWGDANADDAALLEAAEAAQATDVLTAKGGLDGEVESGGRNFSGGQRQRLTIARALTRKPEILILDDSASALDFATDAALRKALRSLPYQPTVFVISQRTASLRHADCIVVLDNGKVVGMGTHEELLKTCSVYREIHESQFGQEAAHEA